MGESERKTETAPDRGLSRISGRLMIFWPAFELVRLAVSENNTQTSDEFHKELAQVAAELAGPTPSPVEWALAETAALDMLALRLYEARYAGAMRSGRDLSIAQSEHAQKRIDRTHRRLMRSLKTLATVRRLAGPTIQVNLAHQQVNVAGAIPSG